MTDESKQDFGQRTESFQVPDSREYVVCLLDLLGQRDALKQWERNPVNSETVRKAVHPVETLTRSFREFFDEFAAGNPDLTEGADDAIRSLLEEMRNVRVRTQQFGDTFLFYAPIRDGDGGINPLPILPMLRAAATTILWLLAADPIMPIRGAITIGHGVELLGDRFYGPALVEVYQLEQAKVGYPRILISERLRDFTAKSGPLSNDPNRNLLYEDFRANCARWIVQDCDGEGMLDFAGTHARSLWSDSNEEARFDRAYCRAVDYVQKELDGFLEAGDVKHIGRYMLLKNYLSRQRFS